MEGLSHFLISKAIFLSFLATEIVVEIRDIIMSRSNLKLEHMKMKRQHVLIESIITMRNSLDSIDNEISVLLKRDPADYPNHNPYVYLNQYLNRIVMTARYLQRSLLDDYSSCYPAGDAFVGKLMRECKKKGWPLCDEQINPFYLLDTYMPPLTKFPGERDDI